MPAIYETYQRHLRKNLLVKGFAAWPPGRVLRLGDVGFLGRGGGFDMRTSLEELGLTPKIQRGSKQPMSATSQTLRQAMATAQAKVSTVSARLSIPFDTKGSVLFEVSDFQHVRIANLGEIAERVVEMYEQGLWKSKYCLIDQVWRASSGTIIVATSGGVSLDVSAEGTNGNPTLKTLAGTDAEGRIAIRGGDVVKVVGGHNLTPMFTCMRLNWLRSDLKPISTGHGDIEEPRLVRLTLDEVEAVWRGDDTEA